MYNNETMELNLTRHEACQISLVLTHIICEMEQELNKANTSDDRKKILSSSIDMWEALKGKIKNQFELQDNN